MTLLLTKNSALCCFIYYIDFSHNFIFLILHLKTEHQTLPSKISSLMKEMWNSHKLLDFPTFSGGKIAFTSNATYILLYLTSRSTVHCWHNSKPSFIYQTTKLTFIQYVFSSFFLFCLLFSLLTMYFLLLFSLPWRSSNTTLFDNIFELSPKTNMRPFHLTPRKIFDA